MKISKYEVYVLSDEDVPDTRIHIETLNSLDDMGWNCHWEIGKKGGRIHAASAIPISKKSISDDQVRELKGFSDGVFSAKEISSRLNANKTYKGLYKISYFKKRLKIIYGNIDFIKGKLKNIFTERAARKPLPSFMG
jgi:hypothetical protein